MKISNFNDTDDLIAAEHKRYMESLMKQSAASAVTDATRVTKQKPVFSMKKKQAIDERYDRQNELWKINESDIITDEPGLFFRLITKLFSKR